MTDRTLFSDDDLRATLDGHIRQLEGDREGNLIQLAESEADPHDDLGAAQFTRNLESLDARLKVVRKRRSDLGDPPA